LRLMVQNNPWTRFAWIVPGVLLLTLASAHAQHPQDKKSAQPDTQESRRVVSVETRPQLFAVLCALDAAGFQSNAGTTKETPGRVQLRQRMVALQGPAVEALRKYYKEHILADSGATFSRFVSFALAVGPPPNFDFELRRDELPPDAFALEGFTEVLAAFYREANIDQLWQFYQPDYEASAEVYRAPVSELVFAATSYLRVIVRPRSPRSFSVYVEPLAGGNNNFRNFGNHYELVVSPSANPPIDAIRHAFLHFLLDPIAIRHQDVASRGLPVLEYATRAPRLPANMRDDYSAFFDECLVRAVELRLRHLSPADLASAIEQAESSGYVLVRPIYAGLSGYEKSEPAMSDYLPDLVKGIDVAAETRRLRGVKFADVKTAGDSASAAEIAQVDVSKSAASAGPVEADLAEGQRQIAVRNGSAAEASFERVLASHPDDLRATFGLAMAAALLGQPDRARELFSNVIAASPNPPTGPGAQLDSANLSWSHIYLGRMYDVEGRRDLAVAEYRAALAVAGAPESARAAAQRGVETGYRTPLRDNQSGGKS
jgi:tetratricopeptide (TPR) repeat protein